MRFLLTPVQQDQAEWTEIMQFFQVLSRMLMLAQELELTATEIKCVAGNKEVFDIDDLSQLSVSNLQTIYGFKELITAFGDNNNQLVGYLTAASENEAAQAIEELAQITGWKADQIALLVASEENEANSSLPLSQDAHQTVNGIIKLRQYFSLSYHLGVTISWFPKLLQLENLPVKDASDNWDIYQQAAQAVREVTKAHYDDEAWTKVSEKLEGELSERKRDVLTAWVIWNQNYENLRHLSQELLIDVETASEVSTSIIKEATLAIQTYLHRCHMGIEPGVETLAIPEEWWQWLMNYRLWEASRKIFLYPENYLDPSLRKTKSPIYKDLEEELLQTEITPESVEKAYQTYFEKFAEIAQLKPAGGYRCTVENHSGAQDTLFLLGRTATEPHTYYSRKCINPEAVTPSWEAWEKIDLTINAEQVNAAYAFNKLFIFWVEIIQIEREKEQGSTQENETETETKATIKYSFQKFGKEWIQPQTLAKDIVIENYDQQSETLWRKVTALPIAANGTEPEKILTLFGDLSRDDEVYQTQDEHQGSCLTIDLLQENTNVALENRLAPARYSGMFGGQLMAMSTENILYDNYADHADSSLDRYPSRGLVGYWSMTEKTGEDAIINAADNTKGTFKENAALTTVGDFPGFSARNVLQLNGNGDCVEFTGENASFGNFRGSMFSIGLWFRTTEPTGMLMMGTGANDWFVSVDDGFAVFAFSTGQTGGRHGKSSTTVNDGNWHHLVSVRHGARAGKLYLDGALVDTWTYSGSTEGIEISRAAIGKSRDNRDFFNGQIAEVNIWNFALTAEQVSNASIPFIPLITKNISGSNVAVKGIDNQPGWSTFDNGEEAFLVSPQHSRLKPIDQSLKTVTQGESITLSYDGADGADGAGQADLEYTFTRLTTSTIRQLSQKMLLGGLDSLLTLDSQLTPELRFDRFSPTGFAYSPDSKQLDFNGPFGLYFWEIFFHIPFLVANTLNAHQRFEEAQKWYHYIFNPTNPTSYEGLLAYLPMDEGRGTETHDLTGINNGTLAGELNWKTADDFPGATSRTVLAFDGENDHVDVANGSNFDSITETVTIGAWIKLDDFPTANQVIVSKGVEYRFSVLNSKLDFFIDGVGSVRSTVNINAGEWYHVAAVYDGALLQLYVDGALEGQEAVSGSASSNNDNVWIGGNPGENPNRFKGQITEVNIWQVALDAEDILRNTSIGRLSDRFWQYLPFRGSTLQKIQETLSTDSAISAYANNPLDPHAVAQLRVGAYEKVIVMRYIDNLLDWGDQLFALDNRESINQATLLYFLAYDLLGEEPENLGKQRDHTPKTVQQLNEEFESKDDKIPQFLIELENRIYSTSSVAIASSPLSELNSYFCTPENEQFIAYWGRVEDRLYKIRHSLNIEGISRQLALFQPPLDPAQLIRAVTGGIQPLSVVSQLTPAVPNYRFDNILERAKAFTTTLTQLGASLLSALEKKDAEELALLRSSHEQSILQLVSRTKQQQLDEAQETLKSLNESLASAQHRHDYHRSLLQNGLLRSEQQSEDRLNDSLDLQVTATTIMAGAAVAHMLPTIFGFSNGGHSLGNAITSAAGALAGSAFALNTASGLADKTAGYERRDQEWEFQAQLAEIDVEQIGHQVEAQRIRVRIAEQELKVHEKSVEQAREIETFLQGKFTNQDLYQWMVSRLSILYFQTYKLALDLAMASQSAFQYELTREDTFINFGYWDSLKKGLLAGESLMLSLNQLEKAYIDGNVRRFELEKTISLLQINPIAFQQLKETGTCEFELSEKLFDHDFPGHYARQIKTMTVAIPAVVGPYQNISATLTQTSNKTLLKPDVNAVEYLIEGGETPPDSSILRSNWRRNQKIALSRGAMDNGLFELNFFWDTRYLPFEATGAVSTWKLELPKHNNRIDFDTISDVIITLSYTALDGGETFMQEVTGLASLRSSSEAHYFNVKQSFPGEWHNFINLSTDTASQQLTFNISEEIVPPQTRATELTGVIFKLDVPDAVEPLEFATLKVGETPVINADDNSINRRIADDWFGDWVIDFDLTKVPDSLIKDGLLNPEMVKNVELTLMYERQIL